MPIESEALGAMRRLFTPRREATTVAKELVPNVLVPDSLELAVKRLPKEPRALKAAIADNELFTGRPGTKTYMEQLLAETGGDGLPTVVSAEELAAAIAGGERPLFRGVSKASYAEQFRSGPLVIGSKNANGAGIWVAFGDKGEAAAKRYATGGPASMLQMSLKADAKVVDYATITARLKEEQAAAGREARVERERMAAWAEQATTPEERASRKAQAAEAATKARIGMGFRFGDLGRYATLLGYDAVEMPSTGYMLVVNRTKLRVQR